MWELAVEVPDVLFFTTGRKLENATPNIVQLIDPASVVNVWSAVDGTFHMPLELPICGGDAPVTGKGLTGCLAVPGASISDSLRQLQFQAALDVLRAIKSGDDLPDGTAVRGTLAGRRFDTVLGAITFDDQGVAQPTVEVELTWRPDDTSNASADFRNASADTILQFLRDNTGPASAGVSKTCGTSCPSSCNGNCERSGNEECCKVASHELPP